jgi:hypothetical protein
MPFGARHDYSEEVTPRQIKNLRAAAAFADEIGHPLTLFITVNWTRTSLWDDPDSQALDKLMELNRKWLKRHAAVFAQIEVRENPCGEMPFPHAHLMLHCPHPLISAFETQFRQAFKRLCGRRVEAKAIKIKKVGKGNPTLKAALGLVDYMCKGVDPDKAEPFGIISTPQGRIYGKRVGISQDINWAARQRYAARKAQEMGEGLQGVTELTRHLVPLAA